VQLGSAPFAVQALTVPDGSITTEKIADGAVTEPVTITQGWTMGASPIGGFSFLGQVFFIEASRLTAHPS